MAFREQDLKDFLGIDIKKTIPSSAFLDPSNPTDNEVRDWVIANIPVDEIMGVFVVYDAINSSTTDFNYAWFISETLSDPYNIIRIKSFTVSALVVNNTPTIAEPTESGNVFHLNEKVISPSGQHWLIDELGNASNLNKSEGDYETTGEDSGYIIKTPDGRYKIQHSNQEGIINFKKL